MSECLDIQTVTRVVRTHDAELVKSIITHPRVYPHVSDDAASPPEEFDASEAVKHPNVYFLTVYDGEELLGLFMFHQHNVVMYEVHTCLLPNAWGKRAEQAATRAREWMFENTDCRKIITLVPQGNTLALRFARRCGLQVEGLITRSYLKGGKLLDQTLLGITRSEKCQ